MRSLLFFIFLSLVLSPWSLVPSPAFATTGSQLVTQENAKQLAEAFQMPGLDKFVGDQARQRIAQELGNKIGEWAAEGLHQITAEGLHQIIKGPGTVDQGPKTINFGELLAKDPELSNKLKLEIQHRLQDWLPSQAKKALYEGLLQNEIVGDENRSEFKAIEQEIIKALNTTLNEQADRWMGGWYDQMMNKVKQRIGFSGEWPLEQLPELFKGSMDPLQVSGYLANLMGDAIGSSTVKGLQNNILKSLNGELPDEALKYLKMGPEKFQEYAEKYKQYLPAEQFAKIKDKVMGIHIVDLPNQVYGGILAASATMHFAKAFAGFHINLYELKRGKEVTETLIWQLRNKESVSLNLGDFIGMVKMLGDQLGEFHWGALKQIAKWNPANQFTKRLDEFEAKLKKIDDLYDKATGKVLEGFDKAIGDIQEELKKLSDEMLKPLKIPMGNCILSEGCPDMLPSLPDITKWDGLKKALGLDKGLFGKIGDKTPLEYLRKAGQKLASALHITGPLAKILKIEKIPPKNPSQDSDFDPVLLHNGEFYYTVTDVTIPGPGLDFKFIRIYRSASDFLGVLGHNWTHNFAERLLPWESPEGPGFTYVDPEGKKYFFKREELNQTPDGFSMQLEDGTQHLFNKDGVLQAIRGHDGSQLTCIYNDQGQLTKVEDTKGRSHQFFYRLDGLLERLEDFTGRVWRFDYNNEAELIAATSPGTPSFPKGKSTGYRYLNHKMTLIMDPKAQVYLQNFYGSDGKVIAQKYGNESAFIEGRYDGLSTWVKDRRGVMHLYEHDEEGHLLHHKILKSDGTLKTLSDAGPRLSPASLQADNGFSYEYDIWGNIIAIHSPDGKTRKFEVDASNLITKEFNNGEERRYFYDANDNIVRIEVPERKLRVEFAYDVLDRMVAKKEFLSSDHVITTHYEYDPQGHLTRFIYPLGNDIRFVYDDEGNLIQEIPGGSIIENAGPASRLGSVSPTGAPRSPSRLSPAFSNFDSLGRPLIINNIQFEWDDNSRLSSITDEKGEKTFYAYDGFNRLILEKFSNGSQTAYGYDDEDRLVKMVDREGNAHQFEYDSEGQLIRRVAGPYEQRFSYDNSGRLIEAVDFNDPNNKNDDVRTQFAYDASSRIVGESMNGRWVYKSYNDKNQKTGIKYPSKLQVVRQFDDASNLLQVFAKDQPIATFKYSKEGLPTEQEWGNGVKLSQDFDGSQRLISQTFGSPDKNPPIVWKYFYGPEGKLEKLDEMPSHFSKTYLYDKKGKLIEDTPQGKNNKEFFYDYDPFGRLIAVRDLNKNVVIQYVYDAFDRLAQKKISDHGKRVDFVYDDWNEIESYMDGKTNRQIIYGGGMDQPLAFKTNEIYFYHTDRLGSVRFLTDKSGKTVESYAYTSFGERIGESQVGNELGFIGRPFEKETGLINLRHRYYSPALRGFLTPDPLGYKNEFYSPSNVFTPRNFSYHQGQGGASRTTFPNYVEADGKKLLLDIDLFYAVTPKNLQTPEMNLYAYAGGDPINFFDPLGLYFLILDRQSQNMALFNKDWTPIKLWEAHTVGTKAAKGNWRATGGPTPSGVYNIGRLPKYADHDNHISKRDLSDDQKKFGWGKIDLDPFSGNAKDSRRTEIRIHGGGTGLKHPFAQQQGWYGTEGCVRMQNEEVVELIDQINSLKERGDTDGTLEVVDSLGEVGQVPPTRQRIADYMTSNHVEPTMDNTHWKQAGVKSKNK